MLIEKEKTSELWKVSYNWLKQAGSFPNKVYFRDEITTHPDYPSLTALTDVLEQGGMEFYAVETDLHSIGELNYPALAHIKKPEHSYMYIVNSINDWEEYREILSDWSGIVIFPEVNSKWEVKENSNAALKERDQKIFLWIFSIILLSLFTFRSHNIKSVEEILIGLFGMLGLFLSVFLLSNEVGFHSRIIRQVCGAFSKSGCENVMSNNLARGIFGITPALGSLTYFTTQFVAYIFITPNFTLISITIIPACVAGIIVIGSIYAQAFIIRDWCALCIGVGCILSVQLLIILNSSQLGFEPLPFFVFSAIFLVLVYPLMMLSRLFSFKIWATTQLLEFKKWKADPSIFLSQLQNEELMVSDSSFRNILIVGNTDAPIKLTIACSPYCKPCATAHKDIHRLMDKFPGMIELDIKLLCPMLNTNDKFTEATESILNAASCTNPTEIAKILTDWFELMNLENWLKKCGKVGLNDVSVQKKHHYIWMKENRITYTPTIFLNGRKMPTRYNLRDLEYLIPQLNHYLGKAGSL
ncbi:hypothetical protein IM793_12520 [Pedobacter sp. MR2016-19]|uniref:vitamin K epoxide reductase family protein n=1 Tax=Pedobacter sp. MR2016-19 TaxID=2780089 RepID=UPI0018771424|nr:vitamin K epoxide reductase family protein [Pedobacter sp. MR2016-19]MBE5319988.1 hypothetical protein [Pedobacter sp. MR2016-19]